jgi:hypothetical protein
MRFVAGLSDSYCTNYGVAPTGVNVVLTLDHTAMTATASLLNAKRVSQFTSGKGCVLQP